MPLNLVPGLRKAVFGINNCSELVPSTLKNNYSHVSTHTYRSACGEKNIKKYEKYANDCTTQGVRYYSTWHVIARSACVWAERAGL